MPQCPIPPCWLWHSKSSRFTHGLQIRLDPRSEGFLRITVDQVPFLAMTSPIYSFLCRFFLTQGRIQSPTLITEKAVHKRTCKPRKWMRSTSNEQDPDILNSAACIFVFGNDAMNTAITTFGASDMVLPIPPLYRFDSEPGAARDDRLSRMFCCLIGVYRRLGTKSGKNHFTYFECCLLSPVRVFCSLIYAFHTLSISRNQMSALELCSG